MAKNEEFKIISEDDYKTLISIYQQKTFEMFNQNIALEAKVSTLGNLVESLTDNLNKLTKEKTKPSNKRSKNSPLLSDEFSDEFSEEETEN